MLVRILGHDESPLYAQIASQLRRAITEGKVKPGERLPPARELAESLNVHMHTVLRCSTCGAGAASWCSEAASAARVCSSSAALSWQKANGKASN
jgi:hypothetical protein